LIILNSRELSSLKDFVAKHYPEGATKVGIEPHSEYNDSTYDNYLQYIAVYDKNGKEMLPLDGKKARGMMPSFGESFLPYETDDYIEDFEVTL